MAKKRQMRRSLIWFLLAILIGMGGLLISAQFGNPLVRFSIVLVSVSVPLFTGGIFMARYASEGIDRFVLVAGVVMLLLGAAASISDVSPRTGEQQVFYNEPLSWLGISSLVLGLFVVLFSVVRAGKAIDKIEERFRHIVDHISEGFVLSSPEGRIVLVNQRFLDMVGLSENKIVGEKVSDLVSRLNVQIMAPHLDLRNQGFSSEYEMEWTVRGDERYLWVSGRPIFDRKGNHMGTLATMRDVTERKKMSERLEQYAKGLQDLVEEQTQKLRQSQGQLRNLLLHMNEGFVTLDSAYRIQFVNNHLCELLRANADTLRGREIFDFVETPSRIRLLDHLQGLEDVREYEIRPEVTFVNADGQSFSTVVAASLVRDETEQDLRYALVVTDVTQLKEMQRQLEQRALELETANEELRMHGRAKDGFLSNVSHELKTPLSTINGYLEMLQSGHMGQLDGPQANALTVMARNVHRLGSLINEMIEFSRMEIRGIQLHMTLAHVPSLIRDCISSIQPQTVAKELKVVSDMKEEMSPVWCDRGKIVQVLNILLSNAAKFTPPGGRIQIRAHESSGHTLEISVTDTGIGIDPANHVRVFEKFFQVDASMTRRYEGAGIGLSIAKSIIEAHGGVIKLDSALGEGSTFTVMLPGIVFDRIVPAAIAAAAAELRVLVVSELDSFRWTVRRVLMECGSYVDEANNAYECIRLAEETEPHLILFDELLSDESGANVINGIRNSLVTGKIPVLIACRHDAPKPKELAESLPDVYLMSKPFTALDLVARLQQICLGRPMPACTLGGRARPEPKTLVMDSDADLVEWIETGLRHRKIACYSAAEIDRAIALARQNRPDVIFLDADAPQSSVARKVEMFQNEGLLRKIPIFLLTAGPLVGPMPEMVKGALSKPFSIDEMAHIVEVNHLAK